MDKVFDSKRTKMFHEEDLLMTATHGIIRMYVAIDNDGLINEKMKPNTETTGVIRDRHLPMEASRLLIATDVISGCRVRYHHCTRKSNPRQNMLRWKRSTANRTWE